MDALRALADALEGDDAEKLVSADAAARSAHARVEEVVQQAASADACCAALTRWARRVADAAALQAEPDADVDARVAAGLHCRDDCHRTLRALGPVAGLLRALLLEDGAGKGERAADVAADALFEAAAALHGAIVDLLQRGEAAAANDASLVCECFWTRKLPRAEELAPQALAHLLVRVLDPPPAASSASAWAADLRRLVAMRGALARVEWADESSSTVRRLLARAVIHPRMLRTSEGVRFLASLFGVHASLVGELHQAAKCQLRTARKAQIDAYAEVYFRAWRGADGQCRIAVESECIQDLMHLAVHVASPALSASLARLLSFFHARKPQHGVDEMLSRLYAPVLWRALSVANPLVRRNAAALFLDAFPLQDPGAPQREIDAVLQKQFDALSALLRDPHEGVRRVSVAGVSRVLSMYWEMIPAATCAALLSALEGLCHDRSSPSVRTAAIDGFRCVLDNHAAHITMRPLLSQITPLIHDSSERVREAVVRLLEFVRGLRSFRFFDIVPLDHLLHRLACERPPLARKIVRLLAPTYFPYDRPSRVVLSRAARLVESNRAAALVFFRNLPYADVPLESMCKLIARTLRLLASRASAASAPLPDPASLPDAVVEVPLVQFGSAEAFVPGEAPDPADGSEQWAFGLSKATLEGLLECAALLWEALDPLLSTSAAKPLRKGLRKVSDWAALGGAAEFLGTRAARAAALSVAARLQRGPEDAELASQFRNIGDEATPEEFEPLLRCILNRGMASMVLEQEAAWLAEEAGTPKQLLSARLLNCMLRSKDTREKILECPDGVNAVSSQLLHFVELAREAVSSDLDVSGPECDVAVMALTTYCKLLVHTMAVEGQRDPPVMQQLIEWTRTVVVPRLDSGGLPVLLSEVVCIVAAELAVVGLNGPGIVSETASLFEEVVSAGGDSAERVVPHLAKFVFHLYHQGGDANEATARRMLLHAIRTLSLAALERLQLQDTLSILVARKLLRPLVEAVVRVALGGIKGGELFESELQSIPAAAVFLAKLCLRSVAFFSATTDVLGELHVANPVDVATTWKVLNTCSLVLDHAAARKHAVRVQRGNEVQPVQELLQALVSEFASGSLAELGSMELSDLNEFASQQLRRCFDLQHKKG